MLIAEPDADTWKILGLVMLNLCGLVIAQFNNYYNWPDTRPPLVKTELHEANKETRIRCQIKERFRHIQNGLNFTWDYKPCQAGNSASCMEVGAWRRLCGSPSTTHRCPPILAVVGPRTQDSGLYRCHITLDGSLIILNVYMLQFIEKRREPPVIVGGMNANVTVVAPTLAALQCKVHSPVPPILRWFRRLESVSSPHLSLQTQQNFIQYLNYTYQLLNCCPVAALSQKDLYLSKLVISSSSVYDSGFYICLAINDANYTFKEAYINVLPLLKAKDKNAQTGSFLALFLIPAMFALIPMLVWVMWLRPRKLAALESSMGLRIHKLPVVQTHVLTGHPVLPASK